MPRFWWSMWGSACKRPLLQLMMAARWVPSSIYGLRCIMVHVFSKCGWLWYQGERWMVMNHIPLCLVCMIIHLTIWDMGLFRTISVFTASKKSCFVNLMGPRRWRVHKQPLLSHSAWCNIGYSSHLRRRSGVYPGDCRSFNIWEVISKPAIVWFFWDVFLKRRIHSSGLDIEVGMSMHSMFQWFLFKEILKLYKDSMTMLCLKRLNWLMFEMKLDQLSQPFAIDF